AVLHLHVLRAAAPALPDPGGEPAAGDDLRVVPLGARLPRVGPAPHGAVRAAAGLDLHAHRVAHLRAGRAPAVRRRRLPRDRARPQPGDVPDLRVLSRPSRAAPGADDVPTRTRTARPTIEAMSADGLAAARSKMEAAGVPVAAIDVFTRFYGLLESGETGVIRESTVDPLDDAPYLGDLEITDDAAREALDATVVIKLNGGLGTSMGMDKAKSLLPVRGDLTFLDVIVRQVLATRHATGARLPL